MTSRTKGTTTNTDVLVEPRLGWLQHRAWDVWFAPKRFESRHLYERLGILWIKRYVPTGAIISGKTMACASLISQAPSSLCSHLSNGHESMRRSIWQLGSGRTNAIGFVMACVVYVLLILSSVLLQRHNRILVYEAIRPMRKKQVPL